MSKRFYPQQYGYNKKAKLDISISDHNFPISQNIEPKQVSTESVQNDNWGDDNDDEILLLASQVCEEAFTKNDISSLPDYSICMQPGSTSTQNQQPSTSKTDFSFKRPTTNLSSMVTTNLKEKCHRISSPLPGISSKVIPKSSQSVNISDDLIFNDKIYKGTSAQDSDYVYRQLLLIQEENAKLKSENGKLLEKCVTKEGEASILRTQLKTCQLAVDNARLEKIKAQEKVQMEWTDKLTAANNQMHDLRTQLDFKNLEIISVKEKCKKLESNKVKLTQVTVANNSIPSSHKYNNQPQNVSLTQSRRVKTTSNGVQTEDKLHFMKLNKTHRLEPSKLTTILPLILEPTSEQHHILDYNEKLQQHLSQHQCRVYNTFHKIPSTPIPKEMRVKIQVCSVHEDLTCIAAGRNTQEKYFNVYSAIYSVLKEVLDRLETVSQRVTNAFQKAMDERYIEATNSYLDVSNEDLLRGSSLYKEEQDILARRMTAILAHLLDTSTGLQLFYRYEENQMSQKKVYFLHLINKICGLIDSTSCATLYSGLLLSICRILDKLSQSPEDIVKLKILDIVKTMLTSRPMPFVVCSLLQLVMKITIWGQFKKMLCPGNNVGNLKLDYDQGVLLYKKESCYLQVLLKQIEACLKCIENQNLPQAAVETTRHLLVLFSNINDNSYCEEDKSRCDCQMVILQVIVYALRISATMLNKITEEPDEVYPTLRSCVAAVCACGAAALGGAAPLCAAPLSAGLLADYCERMRDVPLTPLHSNLISELSGTLLSTPEDMPPSFHEQPWLKSFDTFSIAD